MNLHEIHDFFKRPGDERTLDLRPQVIRVREGETVICRLCSNEFSALRPRCPACGCAHQPPKPMNPPRVREPKDACKFCGQARAKAACPECGDRVHEECLGLHHSMVHV